MPYLVAVGVPQHVPLLPRPKVEAQNNPIYPLVLRVTKRSVDTRDRVTHCNLFNPVLKLLLLAT
jgi:hypothetical protein